MWHSVKINSCYQYYLDAIEALRVLYKAGANPLHADKDSLTGKIFIQVFNIYTIVFLALHCAATCGHASCIRVLVELYDCPLESSYSNVNINFRLNQNDHLEEDINGCTALFYALSFEHLNACRVLLNLKANSNHKDNRGRT